MNKRSFTFVCQSQTPLPYILMTPLKLSSHFKICNSLFNTQLIFLALFLYFSLLKPLVLLLWHASIVSVKVFLILVCLTFLFKCMFLISLHNPCSLRSLLFDSKIHKIQSYLWYHLIHHLYFSFLKTSTKEEMKIPHWFQKVFQSINRTSKLGSAFTPIQINKTLVIFNASGESPALQPCVSDVHSSYY